MLDNRIEDIKAGPGGSGQYGNAINAFRAGNVIVRGNRIKNCDYSAVRGNSASNIQITGNSVSGVREVALYSEFSFEGAVIANNTVDGAALGVSVCNFNEGGRIAVVQGNIIRNLVPKRPIGTAPDDDAGIGIYVEADTSVTGNVIENAPAFGIIAGWGKYLRDVAISGNVIRNSFVGIGVSVTPGAGTALVHSNMIAEAPRGAVVGLDHARPVTTDLTTDGAQRYAQVAVGVKRTVLDRRDGFERTLLERFGGFENRHRLCRNRLHCKRLYRYRLRVGHGWHHAHRWRRRQLCQLRRDRRNRGDWLNRHFTLPRRNIHPRQQGSATAADPGKIYRPIIRRRFRGQQAVPGFHCALGFPDVLQKVVLAVIAAPAAGLVEFGEVVEPLFGKRGPPDDDVASPRDVGSYCHQFARKREAGRETQRTESVWM
ncbi:hypothetical protein ES707_03863 [subsurface metagenome]